MALHCASYNIQYGIGMDGRFDPARIVAAVRDADIVALQEVSTGLPLNGGVDLGATIETLMSDHSSHFHYPVDVALPAAGQGKSAPRFRFGNAILSRFPVLAIRGHLLPRRRMDGRLNLQRGALEAMIATPQGCIRFYSVHLDHLDPAERLMQIAALRDLAFGHETLGGAVSGLAQMGFPDLPPAPDFVLMGDFNFEPGSAEYRAMIADGVIDVTAGDAAPSCFDPAGVQPAKRLDYCFANAGLAGRFKSPRVDQAAIGSDHRPVFVRLE